MGGGQCEPWPRAARRSSATFAILELANAKGVDFEDAVRLVLEATPDAAQEDE